MFDRGKKHEDIVPCEREKFVPTGVVQENRSRSVIHAAVYVGLRVGKEDLLRICVCTDKVFNRGKHMHEDIIESNL